MVNKEEFVKFCESEKQSGLTWEEISDKWANHTGEFIVPTGNAIRKRYYRLKNKSDFASALDGAVKEFKRGFNHKKVKTALNELNKAIDEYKEEKEVDFTTGTISAKTTIEKDVSNLSPEDILKELGYNPSEWELKSLKLKTWDQAKKGGTDYETLSSVRYVIKPATKQLTTEEAIEVAKEAFKDANLKYEDGLEVNDTSELSTELKECDYDVTGLNKKKKKLLLVNQIELHLGKISEKYDTGVEYNSKIALERMDTIIDNIVDFQEENDCTHALVVIGGDYFNSEPNGHTFNGTPIQNDHRYKYLFKEGLLKYQKLIDKLSYVVDNIYVMLCEGNHARTMEFFLFEALKNYYTDFSRIKFIDDYRATQSFKFCNNALFFNHGDGDMKRLIGSLPGEFPKDWGVTDNHYLFIGHFHKSEVCNTENGLQWHRIPAPCSNDEWTTRNRFGLGTTPSYQLMIIDEENGLDTSKFIYFDEV